MKNNIKKLIDFLYCGDVSLKHRDRVYRDIQEANRKSIVAYASFSCLAFFVMVVFTMFFDSDVSRNRLFYVFGTLFMATLLVLNFSVAKKHKSIIPISAYMFVEVVLLIGIMLAISSKEDVTASYMVFLFVAPLLFILKPIYVILMVLISDVLYIFCMYNIQTTSIFRKNIVNAIIYGILSVFISTTMIKMRIQKFETDDMNRILMETDQLTGMLNRRSFEQDIERYKENGSVSSIKLGVFDVNGLKLVNDTLGHSKGDELLIGAAACLEKVFAPYGRCYRIGGDEFIAILIDAAPSEHDFVEWLNKETAQVSLKGISKLSISAGIVSGAEHDNIKDLLKSADAKMYENKAEYYKRK